MHFRRPRTISLCGACLISAHAAESGFRFEKMDAAGLRSALSKQQTFTFCCNVPVLIATLMV